MNTKKLFQSRLDILPPEVQNAINSNQITLVDNVLYFTKALNNNNTAELVQDSDTKVAGITNVNGGKLEAGNYMLLSGIRLRTATVAANASLADLAAADFTNKLHHQVANGELEITAAGKPLLPRISNGRFATGNDAKWNNYFALDCPKLIVPQASLRANLYMLASTGGTVAARLELHGVMTVRA